MTSATVRVSALVCRPTDLFTQRSTEMTERYQVVIVGGGPVGVALAVELGQRGITCAVVERHREVGRIPKGQGLTHRSLEHFYFWNAVDEIRTIRLLPKGYPIGGVVVYGNLMGNYWYPNDTARNSLHSFYFQRNERLPQYLTEDRKGRRAGRALCSGADHLGGLALRRLRDRRGLRRRM
jgi:choline dehydrogenase-like flavoprotein